MLFTIFLGHGFGLPYSSEEFRIEPFRGVLQKPLEYDLVDLDIQAWRPVSEVKRETSALLS